MTKWMPGFPLTRRELAILTAAGFIASCKKEEAATDTGVTDTAMDTAATSTSAAPRKVRVADVHVHLFNANFLPLDGVLAKWVDPVIARAVAKILTSKVDECGDDATLASVEGGDPLKEIENVPPEQLLDRLYQGSQETLDDPEVERGLSSVAPAAPSDPAAERRRFNEMFNQTAEGAREVFPDKGGFFQWITLMTWCERKIWRALRAAYPDVELYISHMMDMENYYSPTKPPRYRWAKPQLERMADLMKAAEGRLLTFFAFDPARKDWQALLEEALSHGCAGVKFYPPNGYGPADEKGNIQANTRELFRFCIREDLPIFTHSTPHGFESRSGYGRKYANPKLWAPVLAKDEFKNLRVCFAHAGGEEGWFPPEKPGVPPEIRPFSAEAIELCKRHPNVYCEIAYLSPILKPAGQAAFQRALDQATSVPGDFPFQKKVMYGSDWHMIHKLRDHRAYLPSFQKALAAPKWDAIRSDFFLGNCVRWLNMRRYLDRLKVKAPGFFGEDAVAHLESLIGSAG